MGKYTIRLDWPAELQAAAELVTTLKFQKRFYKKCMMHSELNMSHIRFSTYALERYLDADKKLALAKDEFAYLLDYYHEHGTTPCPGHDAEI